MSVDIQMQFHLQTTQNCLPITALQTLRHSQDRRFLLASKGCFLQVIEVHSNAAVSFTRVFETQCIHGIRCNNVTVSETKNEFNILVWGGSLVCFIRLTVKYDSAGNLQQFDSKQGPAVDVYDRVLDSILLNDPLQAKWSGYLLTAHNALLGLRLEETPGRGLPNLCVRYLSHSLRSILYSAHLKALSSSDVLVAAGTAFGEIIIWSCRFSETSDCPQLESVLHHVYIDHKGSIFGLNFSNPVKIGELQCRLLASCSDDRTIRIWKVNEKSRIDPASAPFQGEQDVLANFDPGAEKGCDVSSAMAWGHGSRIWDVQFIDDIHGGISSGPVLISTGEDATCQKWRLNIGKKADVHTDLEMNLVHENSDKHHSGKSIWSCTDEIVDDDLQVYTGGADGRIISRIYDSNSSTRRCRQVFISTTFQRILQQDQAVIAANARPTTLQQYTFLSAQRLLALTDSGRLLTGTWTQGNEKSHSPKAMQWKFHESGKTFGNHAVLSDRCGAGGLIFVGDSNGDLFACQPAVPNPSPVNQGLHLREISGGSDLQPDDSGEKEACWLANLRIKISLLLLAGQRNEPHCNQGGFGSILPLTKYCLVATSPQKMARLVWISERSPSEGLIVSDLELPKTFIPTSAILLGSYILVLGSRSGAIAIYFPSREENDQYDLVDCIRHVHAADAVTSITQLMGNALSSPQEKKFYPEYILTTGRDGYYAIHKLASMRENLDDESSTFETIHRLSPPFGPNIEGGYFSSTESNGHRYELILYGFRSKEFVVWNESRQTLVFPVECGGAHRRWTYYPSNYLSAGNHSGIGGSFAWTKAGSFNLVLYSEPDHTIVQEGGHGREIKALAVSPAPYQDSSRHSSHLIATGAEDTTIRLFVMSIGTDDLSLHSELGLDGLRCLNVLKKHTTGLQHLSFSPCGKYLFSSAGCEEFYAWRVRSGIPGVGLGVVHVCSFSKDEEDSDLRITDFEITATSNSQGEIEGSASYFTITAVYSNSMIKVFRFTPKNNKSPETCEVTRRLFYRSNCLTQINICNYPLTASTDGRIALWPVSFTSEPNPAPQPPATNQIHQNSIKALKTISLTSQESLVISGGDDNALGVTLLRPRGREDANSHANAQFKTLLIPRAHAAAITALCIASINRSPFHVEIRFLSTGNDQRVKLWSLTTDLDQISAGGSAELGGNALEAVKVQRLANASTSVADVGAMEMVRQQDHRLRVLVVGVGMEVLRIDGCGARDGAFTDEIDI